MSNKLDEVTKKEANVDLEKREFMGKVGKYAAVGAGMATLMTPTLSTAGNYVARVTGNNGHGNGDQPAPGKSLFHNEAENDFTPAGDPHNNDKFPDSDPLDEDPDGKKYPHYN